MNKNIIPLQMVCPYIHKHIYIHSYIHTYIHTYIATLILSSLNLIVLHVHAAPLDLKTVRTALWDARCKWYDIGVELDLDTATLDSINTTHCKQVEDCFREILSKWLEVATPCPSWKALVKALRSPAVDFPQVASKIESKYI